MVKHSKKSGKKGKRNIEKKNIITDSQLKM